MPALHHSHPEAAERGDTTKKSNAAWLPAAEETAQIKFIIQWQIENKVPDTVLTESAGCHAITWGHIKRGTYKGNGTNILIRVREAVSRCSELLVEAARLAHDPFYETLEFTAFFEAVSTAESREMLGSEEKLVTVLMPTGHGKTRWAQEAIRKRGNGLMIHARPSWAGSYGGPLATFCEALGIATTGPGAARGLAAMEKAILAKLSEKRLTLYLIELSPHNVNVRFIEFLRMVLNETKAVLCLFAVPSYFDRINALEDETTLQLFRRGRVFGTDKVSPGIAKKFLLRAFPDDAATDSAARLIAVAGSAYGGFSLVKQVAEELAAELARNATPLTEASVKAKVQDYNSRRLNPCKRVAA